MNSPDEMYDNVNNICHTQYVSHAVSTLDPAALWLLLVDAAFDTDFAMYYSLYNICIIISLL